MSNEERKKLISEQLHVIAEDVSSLGNAPSNSKTMVLIYELYQVMRQLSDWTEASGYDS